MAMPKGAMVRAGTRDRFGEKADLTPMEVNFVRHFIKSADAIEAARYAGYSDPEAQCVLLSRNPKLQAAIARALVPRLNSLFVLTTDLTERRLRAALESDDPEDQIPLKELRGLLGILTERLLPQNILGNGSLDVPRAPSAADLQAQIDRLERMKSDLAQVVEGHAEVVSGCIDVDASQLSEEDDS